MPHVHVDTGMTDRGWKQTPMRFRGQIDIHGTFFSKLPEKVGTSKYIVNRFAGEFQNGIVALFQSLRIEPINSIARAR